MYTFQTMPFGVDAFQVFVKECLSSVIDLHENLEGLVIESDVFAIAGHAYIDPSDIALMRNFQDMGMPKVVPCVEFMTLEARMDSTKYKSNDRNRHDLFMFRIPAGVGFLVAYLEDHSDTAYGGSYVEAGGERNFVLVVEAPEGYRGGLTVLMNNPVDWDVHVSIAMLGSNYFAYSK